VCVGVVLGFFCGFFVCVVCFGVVGLFWWVWGGGLFLMCWGFFGFLLWGCLLCWCVGFLGFCFGFFSLCFFLGLLCVFFLVWFLGVCVFLFRGYYGFFCFFFGLFEFFCWLGGFWVGFLFVFVFGVV